MRFFSDENWELRIDPIKRIYEISAIGVLLIAVELLGAQQPQPASIEGVVVTLGSGEPLAEAMVQLDPQIKANPDDPYGPPPGRGGNRFAHPDQNGRFLFENITPGEYRLIATRSGGYVPGEYGQRTATGTGMVFRIAAGERMTDVRLSLSPTGSISGRVYDRNGEAVGKAQVQALQSMYKNGHKKLTIIQIVQSNDRGEYRLFWLPPGNVPLYYPGVADAQSATAVPLTAGGTVGGVDISLASGTVPARHILGRVISAIDGQLVTDAFVTVYRRTSDPLNRRR